MKAEVLQLQWHRQQTVTGVDFGSKSSRLVTCGGDNYVRIWSVNEDVCFVSTLEGHQKAVNTVRFSPNEQVIASGDSVGSIILWHQVDKFDVKTDEDVEQSEFWRQFKLMLGHNEVNDLCFSSCSLYIASVGDQTLRIWSHGDLIMFAKNHTEMVQGVTWNGSKIATQSLDRSIIVYNVDLNQKTLTPIMKSSKHQSKLYCDPLQMSVSFFRRLSYSPDGEFLVCPAGWQNNQHCVVMYHKQKLVSYFPINSPAWVVRFCQKPIKPKQKIFDSNVSFLFAVGTDTELLIYETQNMYPILSLRNFHVYRYQDISWSGSKLIASSHDGYCTLVDFDK